MMLVELARQLAAAGMVQGAGGNLSQRAGDRMRVTTSGAHFASLTAADIVEIPQSLTMAERERMAPRPTSELLLHSAAYRARPEAEICIHAHPPHSIALGLLGHALPAITPDCYLHLGELVPLVPYLTPTTTALSAAAGEALSSAPVVLLQNHGVIVTGRSAAEAVLRLEILEMHAGIYLRALPVGKPRHLNAAECRELDTVTGGRYRLK